MNKRMPADVRKFEIRRVAMELAFEFGPTQVTTGMIAENLGLSQPAIYKHFPSKDAVIADIAAYLGARILQNADDAKSLSSDPVTRLKALVVGHLCLLKEYPALPEFMIMRNVKAKHLGFQNTIHAAMARFREDLEADVETAICAGKFRATLTSADATTLIFGVIQSLVLRMLVSRNTEILMIDGPRLLDLQLVGFLEIAGDR